MKTRSKIILIVLAFVLVIGAVIAGKFIYDITSLKRAFAEDFAAKGDEETIIELAPEEETPLPSPIEEEKEPEPTLEATPEPTPDPLEELEAQSDSEFMKNRINILLLGLDRSTERVSWNSFRTDTMILLSIDFENNDVDMISIPRDSYVKIHNKKSRDKVNTAFGTGGGVDGNGYEYAMKTISKLLGSVPVNYYVGFDMNVVKDVVNAMGGVDYDVDIHVKMNGRTIEPGQQHLDGQQVLDYCRQRKGSSDIARVDRQQRMIMAIFGQMKSTGQITNIPDIYKAVETNLDTNLSFKQICSLALFGSGISLSDIGRHTVEGEFLNMNGVSYWGVSNTKLKKMVKEIFGKSFSPDSDGDVYAIKRELREKSAVLGKAMSNAQARAKKGEQLLQSGSLTAEQTSSIQSAINALNAACEDENIDQINAAIAQYDAAAKKLDTNSNKDETGDLPQETALVPEERAAGETQGTEEQNPDTGEVFIVPEEE